MSRYASPYQGLDIESFWQQMDRCFVALLAAPSAPPPFDERLAPVLTLNPEPPGTITDAAPYG